MVINKVRGLCTLSVLWDKKNFHWTSTLWPFTSPWASIKFPHTPVIIMS